MQGWAIVFAIDHYRSKNLLSLSIALTSGKPIVIDSRKTCKNGPKRASMDQKVQMQAGILTCLLPEILWII